MSGLPLRFLVSRVHNVETEILGIYMVVSNHWSGLLDWNTGMDYWTDIFLIFKHIVVVVVSLINSFWL